MNPSKTKPRFVAIDILNEILGNKKSFHELRALGILKNLKEVKDFWKKYKNPFEVIFDKTYDSYLKANGQKSGIESYSKMVGLMINYHKNEKQF